MPKQVFVKPTSQISSSPPVESLRKLVLFPAGLSLALASTLWFSLTAFSGEAAKVTADKLALRVLYCGQPKSARERDFADFLNQHFAKVGTGNLSTFGEKDAEGYDVVLLDYDELKIKENHIQMPNIPFTEKYSVPTITLGATGALVCDRWRLKTGYL